MWVACECEGWRALSGTGSVIHIVSCRDWTQIIRLMDKCLLPLISSYPIPATPDNLRQSLTVKAWLVWYLQWKLILNLQQPSCFSILTDGITVVCHPHQTVTKYFKFHRFTWCLQWPKRVSNVSLIWYFSKEK